MALHPVPPFELTVVGIEWPNYGTYARGCSVLAMVDDDHVVVRSTTEDGQMLTEHRLDETACRRLLHAITAPLPADVVPGLSPRLTWNLGGAVIGSEYTVDLDDFDGIAAWLPYALGDMRWDPAVDGAHFEY